MTQERATGPKGARERTLARILSITGRVTAATPGPWGYLQASGVICGPDATEVAQCLHDPDAMFIAQARADVPWFFDQLQAERSTGRPLNAQVLDRVLRPRAAIGVANDWLNRLLRQGDGLHGYVAEAWTATRPAGWARCSRRSPASSTPRPSGSTTALVNAVGMWMGPPAASGASAARPSHHPPQACGEGVVARLT
jgi:hypothetical protein